MSIPSSYTKGSIGGGTSPRGDVKFAYKGFTQTKNSYQLLTKVTYEGTKLELQYRRDNNSDWAIGYNDATFGRLDNVDIQQDEGPFWHATLSFNKVLNNGIPISMGDKGKPQEHSVDISMYSAPILKHPNYDFRWNHVLFTTSVPLSIWSNNFYEVNTEWAQSHPEFNPNDPYNSKWTDLYARFLVDKMADGVKHPLLDVIWGRDLNEKPRLNRFYYEVNQTTWQINLLSAASWMIREPMQKPGILYWQIPTYTITETGKYDDEDDAQWALKTGGLITFPSMGDFGIQKYYHPEVLTATLPNMKAYWLCDGGHITFDGKQYNATCKYTWSPIDNLGWDQLVYQFWVSKQQYQTDSITNKDPILVGTVQKSPWANLLSNGGN